MLYLCIATGMVVQQTVAEFAGRTSPTAKNYIAEDTFNYLAAGERLNAGHELYSLTVGDRPVIINPPFFTAPLVSPPLIAVLWRPLAAMGEAVAWAWFGSAALAVVLVAAYAMTRHPIAGSFLVLISAHGIAEQLTAGNVAAFFAPAVVVTWAFRDRAWIGVVIGTMAALKLAPVVLFAWLVATRRWRAALVGVGSIGMLVVLSLIGAGPKAMLDYVGVAQTTLPSPWSISTATGLPWLTYALLVSGGLVVLVNGGRDPLAFVVAVCLFTFFTPAFYPAAMVTIPALAGPLSVANLAALAPRRKSAS